MARINLAYIKDLAVEAFMNSRIYEMSEDRRQFSDLIRNLLPQIIENVSLIVCAIEQDKHKERAKRWFEELEAHIHNLRRRKLKLSKRRIFDKTIDKLNLDAFEVQRIISKRFSKENLSINDISFDTYAKIIAFINLSLPDICCRKFESDNQSTFERSDETQELIINALEEIFEIFVYFEIFV